LRHDPIKLSGDIWAQAMNRPPLFKVYNYEIWKMRMIGFIEYNDMDLVKIIKNGIPTLLDK